ncbi:MAG: hypothetical protein WDO18_13440 [Acidobacteriota bacterium]
MGSIYWDDEMPDLAQLITLPELDRNAVLRLFSIRFKVWDREHLSDDEQSFWDEVRRQAPNWAFFGRLELSANDQRARAETEAGVQRELDAFFADADQVTITEKDGIQSFSATFDLNKTPGE